MPVRPFTVRFLTWFSLRLRFLNIHRWLLSEGLSSNVVPMYLGELSPKNLRGAIGIVPQLFITIGILCAQVLGIRHILGNSTGTDCHVGFTIHKPACTESSSDAAVRFCSSWKFNLFLFIFRTVAGRTIKHSSTGWQQITKTKKKKKNTPKKENLL